MVKNKKAILLIIIIIIVGVFLRLWLSHFKVTFRDYDPFYHARMAELIFRHSSLPKWDPRELGGVPYYYPPSFHIIMVMGKYLMPQLDFLEIGSYLNVFFGVLSIPFLYILARDEFDSNVAILAIILFAVSPALIFRSSLWARPNGMNIFLPILTIYVFSKFRKSSSKKWYILAMLVSIFYVFSHSFVILTLTIILIALLYDGSKKNVLAALSIIFIAFMGGLIYYYRFVPYLNFSMGYTIENMPLFNLSFKNLINLGYWLNLDYLFILNYLSFYHLSIGLPLIIWGIIQMSGLNVDVRRIQINFKPSRSHRFFTILTVFSVLSIFWKTKVIFAFLFLYCIAIALSISRIYQRWKLKIKGRDVNYGWSLAITLMLIFVIGSIFLTGKLGEKDFIGNAEILRRVLVDAPLSSNDTVIANDPDLGHEIVYYSRSNAFNSDLTDVRPWNEHMRVFGLLRDKNYSVVEAVDIMKENEISHLLLVYDNQTQIFPFARGELKPYFVSVNEEEMDNKTATLFRINTSA